MTDAANKTGARGYNITLTPLTAVDATPAANDTAKSKFRATYVVKGKTLERTVVARGKAAAQIEGMIKVGEPVALRVIFDRAPANDNGRGGEFLTVIDLPRAKKAA